MCSIALKALICTCLTASFAVATCRCSDPSAPTAGGAFSVTFGNDPTSGVVCPAGGQRASVGIATETARESVFDGKDGADVNCTIEDVGDGFVLTGHIDQNPESIRFNSVKIIPNKTTTSAGISVVSRDTLKVYRPANDSSCSLRIISLSNNHTSVHLELKCPRMETGTSPIEKCSIFNAFAVFENCDTH